MKLQFFYGIIAKIYDLIDIIYFRKYGTSPRKVVYESVKDRDRVLDLCAGTATSAMRIATGKPETKVAAVDLSTAMLGIAKRKRQKQQVENMRLYHMDATNLKFQSECFDKILLSLVLHETEEKLAEAILKEARRVLAQDGELLVTEWERSNSFFRKILFLPMEILEPKPFRPFMRKDLYTYFEKQGFQVVQEYHCDYSHVLKLKKIVS